MSAHSNDSPADWPPYRAFLIRIWRESSATSWCASAQPVQSGEVERFGSLHALFAYLERQAQDAVDGSAAKTKGDDHEDSEDVQTF